MKRRFTACCMVLCVLLSVFWGCSSEYGTNEYGGEESVSEGYDYQIYCINKSQTGLATWGYNVSKERYALDDAIDEVFEAILSEPQVNGYSCAVPETIKEMSYTISGNIAKINVDENYGELDNLGKLFFKAALVMTLTQVDGIEYVYMTMNGLPLTDSTGNNPGYLSANSFIMYDDESTNKGNKVYTTIYYPNENGNGLTTESDYYVYSEQQNLAEYVIEMIRKSFEERGAISDAESIKADNVFVKDGVCYVDFDSKINAAGFTGINAEVILYAIVNSLSELDGVAGVQITIDGRADVMFREEISLEQIFKMNRNLIGGK